MYSINIHPINYISSSEPTQTLLSLTAWHCYMSILHLWLSKMMEQTRYSCEENLSWHIQNVEKTLPCRLLHLTAVQGPFVEDVHIISASDISMHFNMYTLCSCFVVNYRLNKVKLFFEISIHYGYHPRMCYHLHHVKICAHPLPLLLPIVIPVRMLWPK